MADGRRMAAPGILVTLMRPSQNKRRQGYSSMRQWVQTLVPHTKTAKIDQYIHELFIYITGTHGYLFYQ